MTVYATANGGRVMRQDGGLVSVDEHVCDVADALEKHNGGLLGL